MIQTMTNPVSLPDAVRPEIEAWRAEAEAQRQLPRELAEILRAAGAFRLSTPVERQGFELSLGTAAQIYEAFGHIDGPVAWNIWNGNLGFSAALLDEAAADEVWASGVDPIIANSARPAGAAVPVKGGYALSGRWDIVSAIDIADWVCLFGIVLDGEGPGMIES